MLTNLRSCGICCGILSFWGVLQLSIMGLCFFYETFPFLEEAMEYKHLEDVTDIDEFVKTTKDSYRKIAINCWLAAAMYFITLFASFVCIGVAKKRAKAVFDPIEEDAFCSSQAEKFINFDKTTGATATRKRDKPRDHVKELKKKEAKEKKERKKAEKENLKRKKQELDAKNKIEKLKSNN